MLYLPFEMLYVQSENGFVFFEMVCSCFVMLYPFSFRFCVCTNMPPYLSEHESVLAVNKHASELQLKLLLV